MVTIPASATEACGRCREPRRCRSRGGRAGRASPRTGRRAERRSEARSGARRVARAPRRSARYAGARRRARSRRQGAGGRMPDPQLVVATALPSGTPKRGVIDLEHRAGVVADRTDQPEVEDDPLRPPRWRAGHAARASRRPRRAVARPSRAGSLTRRAAGARCRSSSASAGARPSSRTSCSTATKSPRASSAMIRSR